MSPFQRRSGQPAVAAAGSIGLAHVDVCMFRLLTGVLRICRLKKARARSGNQVALGPYLKNAKFGRHPANLGTPLNTWIALRPCMSDRALSGSLPMWCRDSASSASFNAWSSAKPGKAGKATRGDNPRWWYRGLRTGLSHSGTRQRVSNSGAFRHQNSSSQILK